MKSRVLQVLVVLSVVVGACARSGEDPAEDPQRSIPAPADVTTVSLADDPADGELSPFENSSSGVPAPPADQSGRAVAPSHEDPVEAPDEGTADGKPTIRDGTPNQPADPEVVLTPPDGNVVDGWPNQTRDPDVEIDVPSSRR